MPALISIMGALNDLQSALDNASSYDPSVKDTQGQRKFSDFKNSITQAAFAQRFLEKNNLLAAQYENINNKDLFDYQFGAENQRQNFLLQNQKSMEVSALRAAGLNPALAGGGVSPATVNNPTPSAPSQGGSAGVNPAGEMQGLSSLFGGISQAGQNIASQFAQWAKLPSEAKSAKSVAEFDKWHAALEKKEVKWFDDTRGAQISKDRATAQDYIQHARWLKFDTWKAQQKFEPELKLLAAEFDLKMSSKNLNDKQVEIGTKTLEKMDNEINYLKSQKLLTDKQSQEIIERIKNYEPERELMSAQNSYYRRAGYLNYQQGNLAYSQEQLNNFAKKVLDEVGVEWKSNQDKYLPYINAIGQYLNFSLSATGLKKF